MSKRASVLQTIGLETKRQTKKTVRFLLLSHTFQMGVKTLVLFMFVSATLYGMYAFAGKAFAEDVVISKSEIINRVTKLTTLPIDNPEAVVRVENPESLKKQNAFYDAVKEGDYILVYPQLAVIYDLQNDAIVGLKRGDR